MKTWERDGPRKRNGVLGTWGSKTLIAGHVVRSQSRHRHRHRHSVAMPGSIRRLTCWSTMVLTFGPQEDGAAWARRVLGLPITLCDICAGLEIIALLVKVTEVPQGWISDDFFATTTTMRDCGEAPWTGLDGCPKPVYTRDFPIT